MRRDDAGPRRDGAQRDEVHFEDQGLIARGGQGEVRRVVQNDLTRRVAMKLLQCDGPPDDETTARFFEEARMLGLLEHPNIPPVHEIGIDAAGRPFFTMKLVEGETLESLLRRETFSPGSEDDLIEILGVYLKVCDAVAYAHSRGILHRDLKPDNIMVGTHGQVYVMDWGLGRRFERSASTPPSPDAKLDPLRDEDLGRRRPRGHFEISGTPDYMAPEQARGEIATFDDRTDVFTLGGILYRILTGRAPYVGENSRATLLLAIGADIVDPRAVAATADLPTGLCEIAMTALQKEPSDRYASVQELRAEVDRFLRGTGRFPTASFSTGEVVVREGDPGDKAFIIVKGTCVVSKDLGGRRMVLRNLAAGDVFGEAALFTRRARVATVEATTDVVATIVTRDAITQEFGRNGWVGRLVAALARNFREVDARATRLHLDAERATIAMEVFRSMLAAAASTGAPRPETAWPEIRRRLAAQLERPESEVDELVAGVSGIRVDAARGVVRLAE